MNKEKHPRTGWTRAGATFEAVLWSTAALLLGLAGWMVLDAYVYQARNRDPVARLVAAGESAPGFSVKPSPVGVAIGRLSIPELGLSAIVAEGVTPSVLRHAVGRVPDSALPGRSGNIVLAGHRDTFLRELERVEVGDEIVFESAAGALRYRTEWTAVVDPTDVEVLGETGYPALTLVTCYPFGYIGRAPLRFVARARIVERTRSPESQAWNALPTVRR